MENCGKTQFPFEMIRLLLRFDFFFVNLQLHSINWLWILRCFFWFRSFRNPKYLFNLERRTIYTHTQTIAHAPKDNMPKDGHEAEVKRAFNVTHIHNKNITEQRKKISTFFNEFLYVACFQRLFIAMNSFVHSRYAHNFDQFFSFLLSCK